MIAFDATHVVTRRQAVGAEVFGDALQILELHGLIAAHARDRRRARKICVSEIFHHRVAEAAFVIEHVVRKAHGYRRHGARRGYLGRRSRRPAC